MTRVSYLSCRISQLRARGARLSWAQFLARLELGERPAGQRAPGKPDERPLGRRCSGILGQLCEEIYLRVQALRKAV